MNERRRAGDHEQTVTQAESILSRLETLAADHAALVERLRVLVLNAKGGAKP